MMTDIDFRECKFIREELKFITFHDFCTNRHLIKFFFNVLSDNGKIFYQWYVYANIHMNETYKNYCWDYLNGFLDDAELIYKQSFYRTI